MIPAWIGDSRWFWIVLVAGTLWKGFAAAKMGLIFDECYYWEWSLHPQLCYFDHPPLTAWLIAAGERLFGVTPFAIRFPALLSGILLALAGRRLAREMFGKSSGNRAGIFLLLAPIFAGNSLLMTPDTWLAPCWAAGLLFAWRGLTASSPMIWWVTAGAAVGVGMLSKYTMVLFYAALGILWIMTPALRRRLFRGGMVAAVVSFMLFLPVLWWNWRNGWVSFFHQIDHGFRNEHKTLVNFQNLADYGAFLVLLVTPVLGILCVRSGWLRMGDRRFRFLGAFFWTVVVFFGFSAAKAHIEANWPMVAFVSGLLMVAGDWETCGKAWRRWGVILLLVADAAVVTALSGLLLSKESRLSLERVHLPVTLPSSLPLPPSAADSANRNLSDLQYRIEEFLAPETVARSVRASFMESGADFLCMPTYQMTGIMAFYAPDLEPLLVLPDHGRVRFPWIRDRAWEGKTALVVEWPRRGPYYGSFFQSLPPAREAVKKDLPGIHSPLFLSLGRGYKPDAVKNR